MKLVAHRFDPACPVDQVRPHPENVRQGDIGAIYTSIRANDFYGALIVQEGTGYILAGNHRYAAALDAGLTELPVYWVKVDADRARRILLVDNRTSDLATYDQAALVKLLDEAKETTVGLHGTGYEASDLEELRAEAQRALQPPEIEQPAAPVPDTVFCPECGLEFVA